MSQLQSLGLTDADYRKDYLSDKIGVQQKDLEWTEKKYFVTTEEEPLFDAADILRFGKGFSGYNMDLQLT